MHPLLPASTAIEYGHRAAVGLERHRHESGVRLAAVIEAEAREGRLYWAGSSPPDAEQLDTLRVTEDAAEAVAFTLVHVARGWVVRRRLQRGEAADWLLHDSASRPVALEVSGIDTGDVADRLRLKLDQVRRATLVNQRAACVVELATPHATLAIAE